MSNSATIEPFSKQNLITGETCHGIFLFDDYDETVLTMPYTELSLQPVDLVIKLTELKHDADNYGQDSVDIIERILDAIKDDGIKVRIGKKDYRYEDLKDALDYDWRNVYLCPKCGWESWDDDCGDCPNCPEEIEMQFSHKEHYEL